MYNSCQISSSSALFLVGVMFLFGWGGLISQVHAGSDNAQFSSGSSVCVTSSIEVEKEIIKAEDIIEALKKEGPEIDCSDKIIKGNLDLFKIPSETDPDTGRPTIIIRRPIKFRNTEVRGIVSTYEREPGDHSVKFLSKVNFIGARFQDNVSLDWATFSQDANFGDAQFLKMASFTHSTFKKRAGFRSAQFDERALFSKAIFEGETDFAIARFNWIAFFMETEFHCLGSKGANFLFTRFTGDAVFTNGIFKSTARFVGTSFRGPAYFSNCIFENEAWFAGGTQFINSVTFKGAKFLRAGSIINEKKQPRDPVLFSGVIFSKNAVFSNARFHQVAFSEVGTDADIGIDTTFNGRADFRTASFDSLNLGRVIFLSDVDFSGAKFVIGVDFSNVDIDRASIGITWDQLTDKGKVTKIEWAYPEGPLKKYLFKNGEMLSADEKFSAPFFSFLDSLETNFKQHVNLDDAAKVHYLKENLKRQSLKGWRKAKNTVFEKGIYGYGVKWWHQLLTAFLLIVAFAFVYARENVLQYDQNRKRKQPFGIFDIPIDLSTDKRMPVNSSTKPAQTSDFIYRYWQGLRFSSYVLTRIGYGGVYISGKWGYLVFFQWSIGLVLWALFLINLSNTFPLLYRLVTLV